MWQTSESCSSTRVFIRIPLRAEKLLKCNIGINHIMSIVYDALLIHFIIANADRAKENAITSHFTYLPFYIYNIEKAAPMRHKVPDRETTCFRSPFRHYGVSYVKSIKRFRKFLPLHLVIQPLLSRKPHDLLFPAVRYSSHAILNGCHV